MVSILSSVAAFADNKYYPGQILTFGTYEQDDNYGNGLEPLEWIVLSSDGKETMMITRYAVDCKPFNELPCKVRWAGSSLRRWLNNEFYNTAFSSSEQQIIKMSTVDAGEKTKDALFLLSISEAYTYWDYLKNFEFTDYARAMAEAQGEDVYSQKEGYWWLLSHGNKGTKFQDRKACAWMTGVQPYGHAVEHVNGGVRPVIRIKG